MLLDGKRIVVVGGGSGIGAATVRAYVREGARVVCMDVNEDGGRSVVADLDAARFVRCDVVSKEDVGRAFAQATGWLGGLDGAVNVAGIQQQIPADVLSVDDWDRMFAVHARGTFLVNQTAFGYLKNHGGRLINTGSGVAIQGQTAGGSGGDGHYAAAKAAVMAWTRAIAREWAPFGITANTLVPAISTPMYQAMRAGMTTEQLADHDAHMKYAVPLGGKLGDPDDDLAPAMVFLASDMSRFITGQVLAVNGGILMIG